MNFCPDCGQKISGENFCPNCGKNLKALRGTPAPAAQDGGAQFVPSFMDMPFGDISDIGSTLSELDAMADSCNIQALQQNEEKQLAPFEYVRHSNGKYAIISIKSKSELSVSVPACVEAIEAGAFGNSEMFDVLLPDGLIKIGAGAFCGCKNLEKINIPATVRLIEDEAFADCPNLDITLPEKVRLGKDVIRGTLTDRQNLAAEQARQAEAERAAEAARQAEAARKAEEEQRVLLDAARAAEEEKKREHTKGLMFEKNGDSYKVTGYRGKEKDIVIPGTYNDLPVKTIADEAFEGKDYIETVEIGDSVEVIEWNAFKDCSCLWWVRLPASLETIEDDAFEGCGITELKIGRIVEDITLSTIFPDAENVEILPGAKSIYSQCFEDMKNLTSVDIADTVEVIEWCAFENCTSLERVKLPASLKTIDSWAFRNCTNLTDIELPDTVDEIGDDAFEGCGITDLTIGRIVEDISVSTVFPDAENVEILPGAKSIYSQCFEGMTSLTSVTIADTVEVIEWSAFEDCTALEQVKLPASLKTIEGAAFSGCSSLEDIDIPDSSVEIAEDAFYGTPVEEYL